MVLVLQPFQDYFTYSKPIVDQRWTKTGVTEGLGVSHVAQEFYF